MVAVNVRFVAGDSNVRNTMSFPSSQVKTDTSSILPIWKYKKVLKYPIYISIPGFPHFKDI